MRFRARSTAISPPTSRSYAACRRTHPLSARRQRTAGTYRIRARPATWKDYGTAALLREFDQYRDATQKSMKVFRLEAVRAGFRRAWRKQDYATIIAVAGKIPEAALQEDPKLLMWFDQALTRTAGEVRR